MSVSFWISRFLLVFFGAFVLLTLVYWARGHALADAALDGCFWAAATAAVFIAARLYHSSRGRRCELCRDMPEDDPAARR